MSEESINKGSNLLAGVMFVALFIGFTLMALVMINNALDTAVAAPLTTVPINGEAGWINVTTYKLNLYSSSLPLGFTNPTIVAITNTSSEALIGAGNYTLNSATGVITNRSATKWNAVTINWTYQYYAVSTIPSTTNIITGYMTSMVSNFFALMPVVGTIMAVVVLIGGILVLVLYVKRMKDSGETKSSGGFAG